MKRILSALLALSLPAAASAHAVFSEQDAEAGAYYAGFLRITHGCGASPTVAVRIEIPEGVLSAKPQPKPGWELTIERQTLPKPVAGEGGSMITERVSAVTWRGKLPVDQFDQFGLAMKLPDTSGPLFFPTVQSCEVGANEWTDIPPSAEAWHSVEHPAPMLVLSGGMAMEGHSGHH
ncbi:YcnI family protein [Croceibacterium salegens]|uniref:YcnI family protein n=1 Tax=Croceibacterium salegens TaxID=1737568 RepID=UPI002E257326